MFSPNARRPTQRHLVVPSEVPNLGGGAAYDLDEIREYIARDRVEAADRAEEPPGRCKTFCLPSVCRREVAGLPKVALDNILPLRSMNDL